MKFSKRSSVLFLALLVGSILSPEARAGADETTPQIAILEVQSPVLPATVASLAFAGEDAALPDEPGVALQQQQVQTGSDVPPATGTAPAADPLSEGRQTKRILFLIPNFRAVSADEHLPPQSVKEKFKTATLDSLDYSSFIFVAGQAAVAQADSSYPEFGQGARGYGRYYWHTLADAINENYWVEFIIPTALRQDTRYYTLGRGPIAKRLGYAFTRIVITRTDAGHETFNASEILGAGAFSGVANLYYPSQERTFTKTYQRWITNIVIDGCTFVFKEVWPDINNSIFHQKD